MLKNISIKNVFISAVLSSPFITPWILDDHADELFGICKANNTEYRETTPALTERKDFSGLFDAIPDHVQYVAFMDTNHSVQEIYETVFSDEFIQRFKNMGITKLYIEDPIQYQKYIDEIVNNKTSPEEIYKKHSFASNLWETDDNAKKATHLFLAQQMKTAAKNGIEIIATDDQSNLPFIPMVILTIMINDQVSMVTEQCSTPELTDNAIGYYLIRRNWLGIVSMLTTTPFILPARQDDTNTVKHMQEHNDNTVGRAAIFYGASHLGLHETSILSLLGQDNVYTIALTKGDNYTSSKISHANAQLDVITGEYRIFSRPVPQAEHNNDEQKEPIQAPEF